MAGIGIERIKDDMGEVHVRITADFVYSKEKDDIFVIKQAFEKLMMKYAI